MKGGASLTSSGDHQAVLSGAAVPSLPCPSYGYSTDRRGRYRTMSRGLSYGTLSDAKRRHFLHSCYLCKQPLAHNRDVFMYRGDTPFCSEECRQEQIEMDEALEEMKLSSKQKHKPIAVTSPESQKIHVRDAGTAVAG